MPFLYLMAGPNGTGKTSFYFHAASDGLINKNIPFVNIDLMAQSLGGYTEESFAKAQDLYRETVGKYLLLKEDFLIESNLAESRNYDWIASMKKAGYEAVLYFLSTDDVEINIGRIKRRVAEGGHDMPEAVVRSRYAQSHFYLKTKLRDFKEAYLIDNTTHVFRVEARLADGVVIFKAPDASGWINDVLDLVERLQGKRR